MGKRGGVSGVCCYTEALTEERPPAANQDPDFQRYNIPHTGLFSSGAEAQLGPASQTAGRAAGVGNVHVNVVNISRCRVVKKWKYDTGEYLYEYVCSISEGRAEKNSVSTLSACWLCATHAHGIPIPQKHLPMPDKSPDLRVMVTVWRCISCI